MISRARFSFNPRFRFWPARESGPTDCRIVEEEQHRRMALDREQHVGESPEHVRTDRLALERTGRGAQERRLSGPRRRNGSTRTPRAVRRSRSRHRAPPGSATSASVRDRCSCSGCGSGRAGCGARHRGGQQQARFEACAARARALPVLLLPRMPPGGSRSSRARPAASAAISGSISAGIGLEFRLEEPARDRSRASPAHPASRRDRTGCRRLVASSGVAVRHLDPPKPDHESTAHLTLG